MTHLLSAQVWHVLTRDHTVLPATHTFITARCSYNSAVLEVVILSVCPSVCHTRVLSLIQRTYRRYFLYHMKGQSFWFSVTQQWLVGDVPFHLWAIDPPSKIAHVDRFPPVTSQQ